MTGPAANRPVVDEWKLIKRQDNLVKSVLLWPNHCNERLGLISKQVLSSNRKMKVKILQECFSRITETSAYTFKNMAKIANVHPRGVNTSGWTNLSKLAKDHQNCQFCQIRQNRQCSPNCCQYQWMTELIWQNSQNIAKIANFANIVNCGALSPNLPFLSSRAFLDISATRCIIMEIS